MSRNSVATVAMQEDYMKRVRGNGGARSTLRSEGIVILGPYQNHADIATKLGLPVPGPGEVLPVRLAHRKPRHEYEPSIELDGKQRVVALAE
ncbi:NaeI family type II restriction endonuclease [Actinomadura sp. ATCC 39365]